ncbi:hypothetical protein HDE_03196 [Halotydeus destructor]|nr:hypothetical protein HDE_03196 [Halotydeus destructor]
MADPSDSSLQFFSKATPCQWSFCLSIYKEVLRVKAQNSRGSKKGGPEEFVKLDTWYQETLPKNIHTRKDQKVYLTHEELVQVTKWKSLRGKSRARLLDLVRINTELAVKQATQKAFKKLPNLSSAITALTNLKGIGPATASAVLTAGFPEHCPFMADETMLSTPGVEATDFTIAEFVNYAEQIKTQCGKMNEQEPEGKWTPHKVELALWSHYIAKQLQPSLLDDMPGPDGKTVKRESKEEELVSSTDNATDGKGLHDEDSNISVPASNASEQHDKSNDSSLQNDVSCKDESNDFRHPAGNGRHNGEESDSKDGVVPSSEENSNNLVLGEDSNLSNLSSGGDDVTTTSVGENNTSESLIAERPVVDGEPALKKIRAE